MREKAICAMKLAGKAATCMAQRLPHTLVKVREGLRAGEVVGEGRVEEGGGMRGS